MFATGFQSGAFQSVWAYVTGNRDTHDVGAYKRYRKKLERIAKITDERERKKFVKKAEKILKEEIPEEVKQEVKAAVEIAKEPEFDFSLIQAKMLAALAVLEQQLQELIKKKEEELIILLLTE